VRLDYRQIIRLSSSWNFYFRAVIPLSRITYLLTYSKTNRYREQRLRDSNMIYRAVKTARWLPVRQDHHTFPIINTPLRLASASCQVAVCSADERRWQISDQRQPGQPATSQTSWPFVAVDRSRCVFAFMRSACVPGNVQASRWVVLAWVDICRHVLEHPTCRPDSSPQRRCASRLTL